MSDLEKLLTSPNSRGESGIHTSDLLRASTRELKGLGFDTIASITERAAIRIDELEDELLRQMRQTKEFVTNAEPPPNSG